MNRFLYTTAFFFACALQLAAQTKQFKVAAMNVDGLPKKIATITINPDAKGSGGAQAISQKLATKDYDIIGLSEDFNYHGSIMSAIGDIYNQGTHRGSIDTGSSILAIFRGLTFDTDGLELLWRKDLDVRHESWTQWKDWHGKTDDGADGLIKKGFRYYLADFGDGVLIDVYILHMDAETTDGDIAARESQMRQLVDDILRINPSMRPKIVMGDTNCRYTRDHLKTLFIDAINADPRYTMKDAWVEKCKKEIYPPYGSSALMTDALGYVEGEIVDKIFYINPKYGMQLQLQAFKVDTDFNDADGTPLADHYPVVASFRTKGTLYDPHTYWDTPNDPAYTAYALAYNSLLPYTANTLSSDLKAELNTLLTTHTDAGQATATGGLIEQMNAFPAKVEAYLLGRLVPEDATSRLQNPSFEEGTPLASGNVSGWTVAPDVAEAFISGLEDNNEGAAIRAFWPHDGSYVFNTWGGNPANGFYCRQELSLSSGWYKLTATVASDTHGRVALCLGNNIRYSDVLTDRTQGVTVEVIGLVGGKVTVGAESDGWFEADDFQLTYYRPTPTDIQEVREAMKSGDDNVHDAMPDVFAPDGRKLAEPRRGLNIIRTRNGATHKVIVR